MLKFLIGIIFCVLLTSCVSYRVPTNMTEKGVENYIESQKRIKKEKRKYKAFHNKRYREIRKLQRK